MITALDYRKMKGTQEYRVWAGGPGLGILKGSVRMTPEGADNARTALSAWLTPQGFIPNVHTCARTPARTHTHTHTLLTHNTR